MDPKQIILERIVDLQKTLKNAHSSHIRLDAKDQLKTNYSIINPVLDIPCPCTRCLDFYTCSKAFLDFIDCKK